MSILTVARGLAGAKPRGWRPSELKPSDRVYRPKLAAPRPIGAPRLAECIPEIDSQGGSSACVVHGIIGAIGTRQRWLGVPYDTKKDKPSRRDLYGRSRATHSERDAKGKILLLDDGTYIPTAFDQARKHGICLERDFPWSEYRINQFAPAHLLHSGYAYSGLSYERIIAGGEGKIEALAAAFAEGLPVVFGTQISRSFQDYAGGGVYEPRFAEPTLGGHAMYAVDVDPITGDVLLVNSWSSLWGQSGKAWCKKQWVINAWRDLHIVRGWRAVREAEAQYEAA